MRFLFLAQKPPINGHAYAFRVSRDLKWSESSSTSSYRIQKMGELDGSSEPLLLADAISPNIL